MQRGEVEGRGINPYESYMASDPTWIPQKLIVPLLQVGEVKEQALPDVPLLLDQPVKPGDKPLLEFMSRGATVGRPLATTPGVPTERVSALRTAFLATVKDADFIAVAKEMRLAIRTMTAERTAAVIDSMISASPDVRARVKAALEPDSRSLVKQKRP